MRLSTISLKLTRRRQTYTQTLREETRVDLIESGVVGPNTTMLGFLVFQILEANLRAFESPLDCK